MAWQLHNREPVFLQLASHIRADILDGKYPPNSQIPSVRQLACEASVNPNTMQRALTELENEGLLSSHGTVGRFVTSDHTVLEKAKQAVRQNLLRTLLLEAKSFGITKDELLQFIQKEDIL